MESKYLTTSKITEAFKRFSVESKAEVAPKDPGEKIVAVRLDYSKVGVCPYCKKTMSKVTVDDQLQYLCEDDRFVSPLENSYLC